MAKEQQKVEVGQVWSFDTPTPKNWRVVIVDAVNKCATIKNVDDELNIEICSLADDGCWLWKGGRVVGSSNDERRYWPVVPSVTDRIDESHRASKLADICALLDDEVLLLRTRLENAAEFFGPTAWRKFMAREEKKG